ncbi:MAG: hypothetical protein M1825_000068 [Sarcosagium campestre]|nr:MAG: hypothetical protein M1825_000068 [Sarcosagium campestre]
MKFARTYQQALNESEFPTEWLQSAISYGQLKKCIKKVQRELSSLGLLPDTLAHLLQDPEAQRDRRTQPTQAEDTHGAFQYIVSGADETAARPKLTFFIDTQNGVPVDAGLSTETRDWLHKLAERQRLGSDRKASPQTVLVEGTEEFLPESSSRKADPADESARRYIESHSSASDSIQRVEVPLTTDIEFFHLLQSEVYSLDQLRTKEQTQISQSVVEIGRTIAGVATPLVTHPKSDISQWREIFDLYLGAKIFISTSEKDRGLRSVTAATSQFRWFIDELTRKKLKASFRRKESFGVLEKFLYINAKLLHHLKFQEINHIAMFKILKKFDKRTSLGARASFERLVGGTSLATVMAKAICFTVSENILSTVPQLNDYLCPICFSISYKPVRLKCHHVFCIRCMVTMQRSREQHCPLCRGDVVLEADSANLDPALMNFLKNYFPDEVKAKQKENERAAAVDRWGEGHDSCDVM